MAERQSKADKYRANQAKANQGGPDYRATSAGKGDVTRSRNRSQMDLGFDLMAASQEFGQDSPQYKALLAQWKAGRGN